MLVLRWSCDSMCVHGKRGSCCGRWHANMGFELACFRMEMRALPAIDPVTERHARRRTVRLAVTEEVILPAFPGSACTILRI